MKLQIASKDKERYAKENPKINAIKEKLASSDLTGTAQQLNSFLKETQFKTKFDVPKKTSRNIFPCKSLRVALLVNKF